MVIGKASGELTGAVTATVGKVLSTLNVADVPPASAGLLTASAAVPAGTVIPKVPSPVIPLSVTVRVAAPEPVTATVASAVPVLFRTISLGVNVTLSASAYVTV